MRDEGCQREKGVRGERCQGEKGVRGEKGVGYLFFLLASPRKALMEFLEGPPVLNSSGEGGEGVSVRYLFRFRVIRAGEKEKVPDTFPSTKSAL
jgi:hypothetical protein